MGSDILDYFCCLDALAQDTFDWFFMDMMLTLVTGYRIDRQVL